MMDENSDSLRGGLIVFESVGRRREDLIYKMGIRKKFIEGDSDWNRRIDGYKVRRK